MTTTENAPQLAWTGERMIPHLADAATELYHWQRYLYFTPWYAGARVADAASGEGYGAAWAATDAASVQGFDVAEDAVRHANARYPFARFDRGDVCTQDYSNFDLVTSFETIEHLPEPEAFLRALATCPGRIVISTPNRKTHSPGNQLSDRPMNPHHTIEWTPFEFADLIRSHFPDREVRFLSQEARFPGLIREGLDDEAMYCIAVIGEGALPAWPRLGFSIPTCHNFDQLQETILGLCRYYPGEIEFAVVANGTQGVHLERARQLRQALPYAIHLIENPVNLGYGRGANQGLDLLWQEGWFDFFGVVNDDVIPTVGCLIEMVHAFQELEKLGEKPGMVGPVSNYVAGAQQVDIGPFTNKVELFERAETWRRQKHASGTPNPQVRGLCFLMSPDCLSAVGGFDPRFGQGNFEDDDLNLRIKLAGYSLWIAEGAYLYHYGSQTFRNEKVDYAALMERNQDIFRHKWDLMNFEEWPMLDSAPEGVEIFVPLSAIPNPEFPVKMGEQTLDLIHEVSDMEFCAWVFERMRVRPRALRRAVVETILNEAA